MKQREPINRSDIETDWDNAHQLGTEMTEQLTTMPPLPKPNVDTLVDGALTVVVEHLAEMIRPVLTATAAVVGSEALHVVRDRVVYGDADNAETWTGPGAARLPATIPGSTLNTLDAAEAWLLADHDARVDTGIVRPASERARELVTTLAGPIIADVAWDLRLSCRAPGHTCSGSCDHANAATVLECVADELDRDNDNDNDNDTIYPLCCEDADCGRCEDDNQ